MALADLGRRIRAARALADYANVDDLARAIGEDGLRTKTLRAIERGERIAQPRELRAIADACGVGLEFLNGPDDLVRHPAPDDAGAEPAPQVILDALARLEAMLADWQHGGDGRALLEDTARRVIDAQRFLERRADGATDTIIGRIDRLELLLTDNADRRAALEDLAQHRAPQQPPSSSGATDA